MSAAFIRRITAHVNKFIALNNGQLENLKSSINNIESETDGPYSHSLYTSYYDRMVGKQADTVELRLELTGMQSSIDMIIAQCDEADRLNRIYLETLNKNKHVFGLTGLSKKALRIQLEENDDMRRSFFENPTLSEMYDNGTPYIERPSRSGGGRRKPSMKRRISHKRK
jgi:hypothetical protein